MTPPPSAALALLGVWALLTLWVTTTVGTTRTRAETLENIAFDEQSDRSSEGTASETAFPAADD